MGCLACKREAVIVLSPLQKLQKSGSLPENQADVNDNIEFTKNRAEEKTLETAEEECRSGQDSRR